MKTARVTVAMTPEAKAEITARAAALRVPTAELIRRAVSAYDPANDDDALAAAAVELEMAVSRTDVMVDDALAALQAMRLRLADLDRRQVGGTP